VQDGLEPFQIIKTLFEIAFEVTPTSTHLGRHFHLEILAFNPKNLPADGISFACHQR
jgi:hypothetical protein